MAAPFEYVNSRSRLSALTERLRRSERVGLDTEFIAEGAYEPLLCLVQVATEEGIWVVDPLAVADLRELWLLLTEPEREVVVVAAREEVRFCLRYAGRPPERLLDLQIAAGLVGLGYPLSHTNLVRKVLGVDVAGGETFTDWRQRPLSNRQLAYAVDDVRYLLPMREKLLELARSVGQETGLGDRTEWIEAECRRYVERVALAETEERWWRVTGSAGLSRRELAVLRELWRWRDQAARAANLPPRRVLRDDLLIEIAKRKPVRLQDLYALRGLDRSLARDAGARIVAAVQAAMKLPESELPSLGRREEPPQMGALTQLVGVLLGQLAAEARVDPALLATTADVQEVVRWRLGLQEPVPEPELLVGWRGRIAREPILELLDGRRCVRVRDARSPSPLAFERVPGE